MLTKIASVVFFFSSLCFSFWCKQNKVTYLKSQWKLMRTWLVQYYFLMFTDFTNEYLQHRYFSLFPVQVTEIRMKYFDTVPVAAAMCVLKTGFLFTASEFGNQYVLLINKLIIIPFCLNYSQPPFTWICYICTSFSFF